MEDNEKPSRRIVQRLYADRGGVVSRRELYRLGFTRWQLQAELRADRWAAHGRQSIALHTGDLGETAGWWTALYEVGAGAALDGSTALRAAGLKGFEDAIHVSVPKSARPRRPRQVVVHETRRRTREDLVAGGIPRVRPSVAAIRAALWAASNRQAALVLAMAVQQRIVRPADILEAFSTVRRHARRRFIGGVLADLTNGAHSIGELEFAELCRAAGLPVPDRQVRRRGPTGTYFLDSEWPRYKVIAEIEGVHHLDAAQAMADASRQNELTIGDSKVLRIPVIGLRSRPYLYLSQLARLLRAGGWNGTPTLPFQRPKKRAL